MSFNETLIPAKQVLKFLSNITFNVENCIFGILYIYLVYYIYTHTYTYRGDT